MKINGGVLELGGYEKYKLEAIRWSLKKGFLDTCTALAILLLLKNQ